MVIDISHVKYCDLKFQSSTIVLLKLGLQHYVSLPRIQKLLYYMRCNVENLQSDLVYIRKIQVCVVT